MAQLFSLKKITSIRSLLMYWVTGLGIGFVVLYSVHLQLQFQLGVELKTQANFDLYAEFYEQAYRKDKQALKPTSVGLTSYSVYEDIPHPIRVLLEGRTMDHREIEVLLDEGSEEFAYEAQRQGFELCGKEICEIIFVYSYQLYDGNWLYMVQTIGENEAVENRLHVMEGLAFLVFLAIIFIFGAIAFLLVGKVTKPVKLLADWANQLSNSSKSKVPDFQYSELNQVASQLHDAFSRIRESVDKEQQFLQQLSHELRTPLATASGNLEILNMLTQQQSKISPEYKAIERLNYAVNDMKQLTETLLWLNRDSESFPETNMVDLKKLVEDIVETNQYVLGNKLVSIEIFGESKAFEGHETLCAITIGNLIRNAFQYTYEGVVTISIEDNGLIIENTNIQAEQQGGQTDDYGFGLGLDLVKQITDKMNWQYHCQANAHGWSARLYFD